MIQKQKIESTEILTYLQPSHWFWKGQVQKESQGQAETWSFQAIGRRNHVWGQWLSHGLVFAHAGWASHLWLTTMVFLQDPFTQKSKTNLPVEPNNPNWLKTNKQKTMKPNWRKWPTPALLTYYQNEHTFLKQIPQFNNSIEPRWKKKKGLCDSTTGLKQAKSELHMKREHKNFFQKQTDQFYFSNLTPQPHQTQMEEEEGPQRFNKKVQDRLQMHVKRENKTTFQKPNPPPPKNQKSRRYCCEQESWRDASYIHETCFKHSVGCFFLFGDGFSLVAISCCLSPGVINGGS